MRTITSILVKWLLICAMLLTPFAASYFNSAPSFLGILLWFEVIVLGFPWNIVVALTCDAQLEQTYFPGLFKSLNENHDTTVGYVMFIGYVSIIINSFIFALFLDSKRKKKKGIQDD